MYRLLDIDPIDVVTNGIAQNQTTAGAADLLLNGAQVAGGVWDIHVAGYSDGIGGVRIAIDSAGDVSAVVFTVYGTNENGIETTEAITGVTTTAVNSVTYWQTITRIAASAQVASNVFVGAINQVVTALIPLNWRNDFPASFTVPTLTGTATYDIQQSLSPMDVDTDPSTLLWYDLQADKTATLAGEFTRYATAARLRLDSYSSGAELQFQVREQDYNS